MYDYVVFPLLSLLVQIDWTCTSFKLWFMMNLLDVHNWTSSIGMNSADGYSEIGNILDFQVELFTII